MKNNNNFQTLEQEENFILENKDKDHVDKITRISQRKVENNTNNVSVIEESTEIKLVRKNIKSNSIRITTEDELLENDTIGMYTKNDLNVNLKMHR